MTKVGERVIAIRDGGAEDKILNIFGVGIYEGDFPCPYLFNFDNPRIKLDNGEYVWGCMCWWGPEEQIKRTYDGFTFVTVPVPNMEEMES